MYRKKENSQQLPLPNFFLPFDGKLDPNNRWILLGNIIPWQLVEEVYTQDLCPDFGKPSLPSRVAFGALVIKERLGLSDRETVATIQENPYLQWFIGMEAYSNDPPFHASVMVDFRKRFGQEGLSRINEAIALASSASAATPEESDDQDDHNNSPSQPKPTNEHSPEKETPSPEEDSVSKHSGSLIMDATCAPADIRYPTDVSLLNEARQKLDQIIDTIHTPFVGIYPRPRTYRKVAQKDFLSFIKRKQPGRKKIRSAVRKQIRYLERNFRLFEGVLQRATGENLLERLSEKQYRDLLVCRELLRQQSVMYESKSHRIEGRIVSISQPYVRPIVRGKAGKMVEFGAKLSISVIGGYSLLDRLEWENFNEGVDLIATVERYRQRVGSYPVSVHADRIYRTRENRNFCKAKGIRLSGPKLGRPPKEVSKEQKEQAKADEGIRQAVEGKFGQGKRRFGLGRVMAKLASTSAAQIALTIIVMNLEKSLRDLFLYLLDYWFLSRSCTESFRRSNQVCYRWAN